MCVSVAAVGSDTFTALVAEGVEELPLVVRLVVLVVPLIELALVEWPEADEGVDARATVVVAGAEEKLLPALGVEPPCVEEPELPLVPEQLAAEVFELLVALEASLLEVLVTLVAREGTLSNAAEVLEHISPAQRARIACSVTETLDEDETSRGMTQLSLVRDIGIAVIESYCCVGIVRASHDIPHSAGPEGPSEFAELEVLEGVTSHSSTLDIGPVSLTLPAAVFINDTASVSLPVVVSIGMSSMGLGALMQLEYVGATAGEESAMALVPTRSLLISADS